VVLLSDDLANNVQRKLDQKFTSARQGDSKFCRHSSDHADVSND